MITVEEFWNDYLVESKDHGREFMVSMFGDEDSCDGLVNLIATGKKQAGSSLLRDFEATGDELPQVGNISMVVDANGSPVCIIEFTEVIQFAFKDVPERVAIAEGEGDQSIDYWKKVHTEFFSPSLNALGIENLDDEIIVTEFFKVIYSR